MAKKAKSKGFSVAPKPASQTAGVFQDVTLPSGQPAGIMSRRVFDGAVTRADAKLGEVTRSDRKE